MTFPTAASRSMIIGTSSLPYWQIWLLAARGSIRLSSLPISRGGGCSGSSLKAAVPGPTRYSHQLQWVVSIFMGEVGRPRGALWALSHCCRRLCVSTLVLAHECHAAGRGEGLEWSTRIHQAVLLRRGVRIGSRLLASGDPTRPAPRVQPFFRCPMSSPFEFKGLVSRGTEKAADAQTDWAMLTSSVRRSRRAPGVGDPS